VSPPLVLLRQAAPLLLSRLLRPDRSRTIRGMGFLSLPTLSATLNDHVPHMNPDTSGIAVEAGRAIHPLLRIVSCDSWLRRPRNRRRQRTPSCALRFANRERYGRRRTCLPRSGARRLPCRRSPLHGQLRSRKHQFLTSTPAGRSL
jgi:hypothetical protein